MQTLILLSLLLALLHIWLLPMILNAKNMEYLLSNRDGAVKGEHQQILRKASLFF